MQIGGKPLRVKLKVNLEERGYGKGLIEGALGWTIPDVKLSIWGSQDRFVAVKFDNGLKLDIIFKSLEVLTNPEHQDEQASQEEKK